MVWTHQCGWFWANIITLFTTIPPEKSWVKLLFYHQPLQWFCQLLLWQEISWALLPSLTTELEGGKKAEQKIPWHIVWQFNMFASLVLSYEKKLMKNISLQAKKVNYDYKLLFEKRSLFITNWSARSNNCYGSSRSW